MQSLPIPPDQSAPIPSLTSRPDAGQTNAHHTTAGSSTLRFANWPHRLRTRLPGLILAGSLALAAMWIARHPWLQTHGLGTLTLALALGLLAGPLLGRFDAATQEGLGFSKQILLRLGIVLYGLRLTLQDIGSIGWQGVLFDAIMLGSTFMLAWILGTRLFKLDERTSMLIGAGSSICGAAAVIATAPVLQARPAQVTVAISTVVLFGTLALFLYPQLYQLNLRYMLFDWSAGWFGLFTGATIHEVAQVVAAGQSIGEEAAYLAVVSKMARVMMLAPFLIGLSFYVARVLSPRTSDAAHAPGRIVIPWFAFGFLLAAGLNSWLPVPVVVLQGAHQLDTFCLAAAMAALGCTTRLSVIRQAGWRPILLAALLFGWLVGGGMLVGNVLVD